MADQQSQHATTGSSADASHVFRVVGATPTISGAGARKSVTLPAGALLHYVGPVDGKESDVAGTNARRPLAIQITPSPIVHAPEEKSPRMFQFADNSAGGNNHGRQSVHAFGNRSASHREDDQKLASPIETMTASPSPPYLSDMHQGALFRFSKPSISKSRSRKQGLKIDLMKDGDDPSGSNAAGGMIAKHVLPPGSVIRRVSAIAEPKSACSTPRGTRDTAFGSSNDAGADGDGGEFSPMLFQFLGTSNASDATSAQRAPFAIRVEPLTPASQTDYQREVREAPRLFHFMGDTGFPEENGGGMVLRVSKCVHDACMHVRVCVVQFTDVGLDQVRLIASLTASSH